MNLQTHSKLDEEELLHLAIEATRSGRHGDAIQYLKEAASKSEGNAKIRFLLGAEHAQIGLYDRAQEDLAAALDLDPALVPARFQLGLLHLVQGRSKEAADVWKPLDSLSESDPYLHFSRGLEALARGDLARCRESLTRGLALNRSNPALNADMQRMLEIAGARAVATPADAPKPGSGDPAAHVLLSAYTRPVH